MKQNQNLKEEMAVWFKHIREEMNAQDNQTRVKLNEFIRREVQNIEEPIQNSKSIVGSLQEIELKLN